MKLLTVLLMVGLAGCAWGQQCVEVKDGFTAGDGVLYPTLMACKNPVPLVATKPLKCGPHQHVEGEYGSNGSIYGRCADDLKCGKYQYVKTDTWVELNDCRPIGNGKLECSPPVPRCEDKIYPMTLAEYEQILARLKALENKR